MAEKSLELEFKLVMLPDVTNTSGGIVHWVPLWTVREPEPNEDLLTITREVVRKQN
jgi:hypothetical protein